MLESLTGLANSWLYSIACRAAVKAGQKLSEPEMSRLLSDMAQTPNGAYCPHGRPAIQRYSIEEIEKKFHR
jgi:DNA mismatch repair protein MutL